MKKIKLAQQLFDKALDVVISSTASHKPTEEIKAFKEALKQAVNDDISLDDTYTIMYCTNGDIDLFTGDITDNWQELIQGNWNGKRYVSHKRNAEMFSTSLYNLMTQDNPGYIDQAIEEIRPGYTPAQVQDSYILTLDDLLDDKGFLKAIILDDRYLVRTDEIDKVEDWLHVSGYGDKDVAKSYRLKAWDMLDNKAVDILYLSEAVDDFFENGNIMYCNYFVLNDTLVDELYNKQVEGTGEGIIIKVGDRLIEVKFTNDDIREYLDTQATGEELLDLYQANEEEVDKHFIREQLQDVIKELEYE